MVKLTDFYKTNGLDRKDTDHHPVGASMTRQEFADECDINNLMKQYEGHLANPMASLREPVYVDFTAVPSTLMETMDILHAGTDAFMSLPASVRKEFDNNAVAFVDFASNPDNIDKLRELGLAKPKPAPAPEPAKPAQVVPPAAAPPAAPDLAKTIAEAIVGALKPG